MQRRRRGHRRCARSEAGAARRLHRNGGSFPGRPLLSIHYSLPGHPAHPRRVPEHKPARLTRGQQGSPGCHLPSPSRPGALPAPRGAALHKSCSAARNQPGLCLCSLLHRCSERGQKCRGTAAPAAAWFPNPLSRDAALALPSTVTQPLVWAFPAWLHYYYHDKDKGVFFPTSLFKSLLALDFSEFLFETLTLWSFSQTDLITRVQINLGGFCWAGR